MPTGPTAAIRGLHRGAQGTVRTELVCALGIHSDAPVLKALCILALGRSPQQGECWGFY